MKRWVFDYPIEHAVRLKQLLPAASNTSPYFSFLDSNEHQGPYQRYEWLAAFGAREILRPDGQCFEALREFHLQKKDWLFGHLSYDLKNDLEHLNTTHPDTLGFSPMLFFIPETVIYQSGKKIKVESYRFEDVATLEQHLELHVQKNISSSQNIELKPQTTRKQYLKTIAAIKEHLQYGNIYEMNYCLEFAASVPDFKLFPAFQKLNSSAKAPFAALYKNEDSYLLCASPERYLQKQEKKLISQPIKGTIRRADNKTSDELLKRELLANEKERSENVMITDLVRNDLSRTAQRASVKVEELFGIYTFNTVHQMITTISSKLADQYNFADALKTTFPMGSMTGAPKLKAMELIDKYESFARNLYSGAVGYITPYGDFDFNVVIRSIFYNQESGYLSARVGSAITIHCEASQEYDECLLKAENLFQSLRT